MKTKAFTLVELLTVIGILAVLIAILLPVLASVRGASKANQCLSNTRQVAQASYSYATDNRDFWINYRSPFSDSAHLIWDRDAVGGDWWSSRLHFQDYLSIIEVLLCPEFQSSGSFAFGEPRPDQVISLPVSDPASQAWNTVHYGYNVRFLGSRQEWPLQSGVDSGDRTASAGQLDQTPRMGEIRSISATIAFADSKNRALEIQTSQQTFGGEVVTQGIGYLFPAYDPPEIQFGYAHARHSNSINVMWADGHGSSVSVDDPDDPYTPDGLTNFAKSPDDNLWDLK